MTLRTRNGGTVVANESNKSLPKRRKAPIARGYVRAHSAAHSLQEQCDALAAAGVADSHMYIDIVSGDDGPNRWPALATLLSDANRGESVVVGGLDRLGRTPAEIFQTIRALSDRGLLLRSLHETIDLSSPTGLIVAGALSTLQRPQMRHGPEHSPAGNQPPRRQRVGRPHALDKGQAVLAHQLFAIGVPKTAIAKTLGVSRPTVYKALSATNGEGHQG